MDLRLRPLGLGTETLLSRGLIGPGWGVFAKYERGVSTGEGERELSEEERTSLAGERDVADLVGVARVGWGKLMRSDRGDPRIGEEGLLLFSAMSRHFLDLELTGVLAEELSGVIMCFFSTLLELMV